MQRSITSHILVAASCCALSASALAQCDVYRLDIPDFDQRREAAAGILGLPGNGGSHCAPASAMNWLAYITNHGYPEVLGGARNWQSGTHYNTVTSLINWVGTMMNTGSGTNNGDHRDGLEEWLEMTSPDNFIVSLNAPSGGQYAPSPEEIYDLMSAGALVTICTKHHTFFPSTIAFVDGQLIPLPNRYVADGGGHCVSVARITDGCSNLPRVWFRDPSGFDGPNEITQGTFVTQFLDAEPLTASFAATDTSQPINRTMYRFVDDDPDRNSIIHALVVVMPIGGLSADAEQGVITVMNQHSSSDFAVLPDTGTTHSTPGNAPIIGMRYLPHLGAAAVLTRTGPDRGTLYRFRTGTGEFEQLATIDSPGDMAVGAGGEIYVASSRHAGGVNVCMADGSVRFISTGVYRPLALAYDDANDRVVMIMDNQHGTHVAGTIGAVGDNTNYFTNDYSLTITPIDGLPSVPVIDLVIDPRSADSGGGGVYVAVGDLNGITPLIQTPNGWVFDTARTIPIQNPKNLQIDSRGRFFCTSNGVTHQFVLTFNGQTTTPTPVLNPNYKFAGRAVGDIFQVTVGRVGSDTLVGASYRPIDDPSSFPTAPRACEADINNSGDLTVQDLFDFLAAYFASDLAADINESGSLSAQDVFDFLAAYFAGCN